MDSWIVRLVEQGGYAGIFALMLLETLVPPVPSELIMTTAGVAAARGTISFGGAVAAGSAGAMLGNYLWFLLALRLGRARLMRLVARHGRWLTIGWAEVERGEALFARWGGGILIAARMLPAFRTLISVPAALLGMGHRRFLAYSTLGTVGWSAMLAGAGFGLSQIVGNVEWWLGMISTAVLAAIALIYVWRLVTYRAPD